MSSTPVSYSLTGAERRVTGTLAAIFALRMFGLFLLLPVFSLFGEDLEGATPALIGTALGVYGLLQALLQVPFGYLSDRFGRRPMILGGLALFVLGGVVAALSDHIYGVILGRALQGAGAIASVVMALVGDSVADERRTRAMAMIGMSVGGAFVFALIVAPLLAGGLGLPGLFWATVVLGLAALVVAWVRVPAGRGARAAMRSPLSIPALLGHPDLWRLNLGIFCLHLVMTATFVVVPWALREQAGLAVGHHSLLYLGVMVGGVLGMVPMIIYAERRRPRPVMVAAIVLLALSELLLAWAGVSLAGYVVALLLFFTAFNLLEALLPSLVGRAVPAGTRGVAMGVYSSCQFIGVFAGAQLGGVLLGNAAGAQALLLCAGLLAVWAIVAAGLKELPKLQTHAVSLAVPMAEADRWLHRALQQPGVVEGLLVPEEGSAVLRVDPELIDEGLLKQWLEDGAQGQ